MSAPHPHPTHHPHPAPAGPGDPPQPPVGQAHGHAGHDDHDDHDDHPHQAESGCPRDHHGAHEHHAGRGHGHHGHSHGHSHGHAHAPAQFDRAFAIGIALNLAFVAVEAGWGWRVGSLALLADAGHNLGDVAGLVLAWVATLAARRPADARRTYGWKRAGIVAAVLNSLLLLVAMGSLGWEAVQRLGAPVAVEGVSVMVVAAIGIVINGATALLFMRGSDHDINLRGAYLHMAGDALVSAGVVVAGALSLWLGWRWVDPVAGLLITALILLSSWSLLRQSLHLLFDGVPDGIDLRAVAADLQALPGVAQVHDLHVWAMGSAEVALTAHLVMPGGVPGGASADGLLRDATAQLRERHAIHHVTLQLQRSPLAGGCAVVAD